MLLAHLKFFISQDPKVLLSGTALKEFSQFAYTSSQIHMYVCIYIYTYIRIYTHIYTYLYVICPICRIIYIVVVIHVYTYICVCVYTCIKQVIYVYVCYRYKTSGAQVIAHNPTIDCPVAACMMNSSLFQSFIPHDVLWDGIPLASSAVLIIYPPSSLFSSQLSCWQSSRRS